MIIFRLFYVDGFNPLARWSTDLTNDVIEISDNILKHIKKTDVKNMWDDYDLINLRVVLHFVPYICHAW
jgi:hypothetical protein